MTIIISTAALYVRLAATPRTHTPPLPSYFARIPPPPPTRRQLGMVNTRVYRRIYTSTTFTIPRATSIDPGAGPKYIRYKCAWVKFGLRTTTYTAVPGHARDLPENIHGSKSIYIYCFRRGDWMPTGVKAFDIGNLPIACVVIECSAHGRYYYRL